MPSPDDVQTLEFALGFILLLGVILYAVLGGADFGGGVWDLLARGPRANQQREVIAHAIGPIWEANHVWLIFVIVIVFTVFPPVYAALSVALFVPLTLALVGIVFRGVAFVFRTPARSVAVIGGIWDRVFAIASVVTPVFFGMAAGAVASGQIQVIDGDVQGGPWTAWLAPFPLVIGLLAVTRLDTISLALPIAVVAIWPLLRDRPAKWITKVVVIATPSAVFGLGTVVSFWAYFGQVVPTTVDNRVRSPIAVAALAVVSLVAFAIMAGALDRFGRLRADSEARDLVRRSTIRTFAVVGASAVLLVVAVTALADWNQVAATLSASIACGLLWTGALLVVAAISPTLRSGRFRYFVVIALWVPSYEIVFGPTRLAVSRVVASSVPALSIVAVIIVARAVLLVRAAAEGPSTARQRTPIRAVYASVALLPLVVLSDASGIGDRAVTEATYSTVIDLCCSIEPIAEMNIDIGRDTVAEVDERIVPIIAVPDIGKVAFADAVNIVDTGMIGDPVYTKIATAPEGPFRDEMMRFYLFEVYPPDVWDLHEPYSCQLAPVQADRRFDGWYRRLDIDRVGRTDFLAPNSGPGDYVQGLFVLRDPASRPDLVLAKELLSGTPPEASFFEACRTEDELDDCFDHLRAFQRAYPGTAGSERAASLTAGLEDTAPGRLAVALLDAPVSRTWSEDAFDAVTEIVSAKR